MKSNLCIGSDDRQTLPHNVLGLQASMQYCLTIKHDDMSFVHGDNLQKLHKLIRYQDKNQCIPFIIQQCDLHATIFRKL